jgi:tetratricopeptide (TPR) repeat protein
MAKRVSKKRSKNNRLLRARAQKDPIPLLREALRMLRRGNHDRALKLANDGLYLASSKDEQSKAQEILAEIHFRAAMQSSPSEQVVRLEKALALRPNDARIRFRYAIALWRVNRLPAALNALEKAYKENPNQHPLS